MSDQERYRGQTSGIIATPDKQARCRQVLSSWRCVCVLHKGCECFPLKKIVERASEGKPLFYDQVQLLEQLLKRGEG